jgi:t-SNARE complex subunit (syntaxin)
MTQDEQKQLDHLQQRLTEANQSVEQTRARFSSALLKSNNEARLYRGLFWTLLVLALAATIVRLVQK